MVEHGPDKKKEENHPYQIIISESLNGILNETENFLKTAITLSPELQTELRAIFAETSLKSARAKISELEKRIGLANQTIRQANLRIEQLKRLARIGQDDLGDPKGYFRILGFHSSAFEGLTEDQVQKLVNAGYRVMSWVHHPDHEGNPTKMAHLNDARDVLSDPLQRREYLERQGRFRT